MSLADCPEFEFSGSGVSESSVATRVTTIEFDVDSGSFDVSYLIHREGGEFPVRAQMYLELTRADGEYATICRNLGEHSGSMYTLPAQVSAPGDLPFGRYRATVMVGLTGENPDEDRTDNVASMSAYHGPHLRLNSRTRSGGEVSLVVENDGDLATVALTLRSVVRNAQGYYSVKAVDVPAIQPGEQRGLVCSGLGDGEVTILLVDEEGVPVMDEVVLAATGTAVEDIPVSQADPDVAISGVSVLPDGTGGYNVLVTILQTGAGETDAVLKFEATHIDGSDVQTQNHSMLIGESTSLAWNVQMDSPFDVRVSIEFPNNGSDGVGENNLAIVTFDPSCIEDCGFVATTPGTSGTGGTAGNTDSMGTVVSSEDGIVRVISDGIYYGFAVDGRPLPVTLRFDFSVTPPAGIFNSIRWKLSKTSIDLLAQKGLVAPGALSAINSEQAPSGDRRWMQGDGKVRVPLVFDPAALNSAAVSALSTPFDITIEGSAYYSEVSMVEDQIQTTQREAPYNLTFPVAAVNEIPGSDLVVNLLRKGGQGGRRIHRFSRSVHHHGRNKNVLSWEQKLIIRTLNLGPLPLEARTLRATLSWGYGGHDQVSNAGVLATKEEVVSLGVGEHHDFLFDPREFMCTEQGRPIPNGNIGVLYGKIEEVITDGRTSSAEWDVSNNQHKQRVRFGVLKPYWMATRPTAGYQYRPIWICDLNAAATADGGYVGGNDGGGEGGLAEDGSGNGSTATGGYGGLDGSGGVDGFGGSTGYGFGDNSQGEFGGAGGFGGADTGDNSQGGSEGTGFGGGTGSEF
jgi:hypothetical protein